VGRTSADGERTTATDETRRGWRCLSGREGPAERIESGVLTGQERPPTVKPVAVVAFDMASNAGDLVSIPVDDVELEGTLSIPDGASGVVVFAHGSGSSRKSPRNNYVADVIRDRGLGTLLFDLLTEEEDQFRENRFDISLLTDRLVAVTEWLWDEHVDRDVRLGYFGSSTGAASALRAAARLGDDVDAVVSRGGRVDMAADVLGEVGASTLFIVGGADTQVLELNREAYEELTCEKDLHVVEEAGHLFEGEGELEEVAEVAADWFEDSLS
jgi:dienelactone hydrolase